MTAPALQISTRPASHNQQRELVRWLLTSLWRTPPPSHAVMMPKGYAAKYVRRNASPSLAHLDAHLAGGSTIAAPLIGADGLAQVIAADIDSGGQAALVRLLEACQVAGVAAVAFTSVNEAHNGGWVWAFFDAAFEPARGRLLIQQLAKQANVSVEAYPSRADARLPFGRHTWTGRRGRAIFQDGQVIDLDEGPDALLDAGRRLASLAKNSLGQLPQLPRREQPNVTVGPVGSDNPIQAFNGQAGIFVTLLESAGATIAQQTHEGAIFHCTCGGHGRGKHNTALQLVASTNPQRYGSVVLLTYGTGCIYYRDDRRPWDAFGFFCKLKGLDPGSKEALAAIGAPIFPTRRAAKHVAEPLPEEPTYEVRRRLGEIAQRHDDAASLHAALRERAEADEALLERARKVLAVLLELAPGRSWCRPSVTRLAELAELELRTTHRALRDLEAAGYIESLPSHGRNTVIRRFLPMAQTVAQTAEDATGAPGFLSVTPAEQSSAAPAPAMGREPGFLRVTPGDEGRSFVRVTPCHTSIQTSNTKTPVLTGKGGDDTASVLPANDLSSTLAPADEVESLPPQPQAPQPVLVDVIRAQAAELGRWDKRVIARAVQAAYPERWSAERIGEIVQLELDARKQERKQEIPRPLKSYSRGELEGRIIACRRGIKKYQFSNPVKAYHCEQSLAKYQQRLAQLDAVEGGLETQEPAPVTSPPSPVPGANVMPAVAVALTALASGNIALARQVRAGLPQGAARAMLTHKLAVYDAQATQEGSAA
jgi:DNA-binding MarR family transcriptional regulator